MRKLLLASLVLSCACLTAQNRYPAINLANSDPSGTGCTLPNGISEYGTNLYICSGGTWHAIAGSGSGTVSGQTPAFLPLATAATTIGKASPLSVDDVNTPTKVTSTVPINAPALNGIYNLKAAFGASGSNQTMTCTATASSATLTSCTGGDFSVGQWVYIQGAGNAATAVTPTTPTASCTSGNGGSCTGSVVYSYKVVGVQGIPDGAMTAPSAAISVTQAAQTQAVVSGSSAPWVNTTVSWTSETNVSVWLVYKSINGGPYNYYTMVYEPSYGTTITDNGTISSLQFNCNDDGVPCVAPSGATSNDVFAQITNISGGIYTLAAGTNQGSFRTGFGLSGQLPSRPGTSGTFVVQHDDEPAFIAAYQYLLANSATQIGQVELHIPAGVYNLHLECGAANSCYSVNPTAISFSGLKNVTFAGDGASTVLNASLDRSSRLSLFMGAYCGSGAPGACSAMYATYSTGPGPHVFVANDPIPVGSYSLTMTTAGDAANFPAGSWLQIFPNNQPYPCGKAIDTNQVLTSDSTTGILTLLYPVARYYSASLPAPWSQSGCASWAPVVGQMTGGLAASHITVKNMHVRADMLFESTSAVDFLTVEGMQIEDNATEETGQDRHFTYTRNVITEGGNQGTNLRGILTAAFGSEDMTASYNTFTAPSYSATDNQNCVEHSANVSYIGNTMTFAGVGKGLASNSLGGAITVASGCDNFQFLRNTVNLWSTDTKSAIYIQGGVVNGQVRDNNFFVDAISQTSKASAYVAALMSGSNPIFMSGNNWTIGSGTPNTPLVTPSTHIQPGFRTIAYTSGSGTVRGDFQYGGANIFTDTLTGNVTTVILGQNRIAGYAFSIQLTQAAAGGPYTLPSTCASTGWSLGGGNGIDCPSGPPVVNPTASSLTVLSFFDDGTTVHYIGTDYTSTTNLSDWTNSGVANGYIPIWNSATKQWSAGPVPNSALGTVGWLQYLGDGSEGALTCSGAGPSAGTHWYSSFLVNAGATCTMGARGATIRVTGTCTINGTVDASAVGAGTTSLAVYGGSGAGGGGGAATGTAGGSTTTLVATGATSVASGGSAGTSGNPGSSGNAASANFQKAAFDVGPAGGYGFGGGGGGAGGSSGGAAGNGGESVVFACSSIVFGANNLIDVSGGPGQPSTANSVGAGGGGGGGIAIFRSPSITGTATVNSNGGPGGSCTVPMAQWSGGGGSGLTTTATVTTGAISACSVGGTTTGFNSAPKCTIVGGGGTGGTCHYTFSGGTVTGCVVDAGGSGYTSSTFTTCGAGGTGAAGWTKTLAQ